MFNDLIHLKFGKNTPKLLKTTLNQNLSFKKLYFPSKPQLIIPPIKNYFEVILRITLTLTPSIVRVTFFLKPLLLRVGGCATVLWWMPYKSHAWNTTH